MQMKAFYLISVGSCLSVRVLFLAVTKKPVQSYFQNTCHTSTHMNTLCPFTSSRGHTPHLGNTMASYLPHWPHPNYSNGRTTKGDVYCCLPWMPSPCHKLYIVPVKVIQPFIVEVGSSHQEGEKSQASCSDHCKWCLNYVSVSFSGEDFEILSFHRERGWVAMYEVLLPYQLMPQFSFPLETVIDV